MSEASYNKIVKCFEENKALVREHYEHVVKSGQANDPYVRAGYDLTRHFLGNTFITGLYRTEDLKDTHIRTAIRKAMKSTLS